MVCGRVFELAERQNLSRGLSRQTEQSTEHQTWQRTQQVYSGMHAYCFIDHNLWIDDCPMTTYELVPVPGLQLVLFRPACIAWVWRKHDDLVVQSERMYIL